MTLPLANSPAHPSIGSRLNSRPLKRTAFFFIFFCAIYLVFFNTTVPRPSNFLPDRLRSSFQSYDVSSSELAEQRNRYRSAKPKAAFVVFVRERNLNQLLPSIRDIQWAFNDDVEHGYDYIFLSEDQFTPWFQDHIIDFLSKRPSKPKATFGLVSKEDWDIPAHIDMVKAKERWDRMGKSGRIPYGGSKSYRQMCRYMSGPIFHHPLLKDLDYYWRLEPETKHLCTYQSHWKQLDGGKHEWVERDPFRYMRDNNKKYAWVISMLEYRATVMTLMVRVNWWRRDNPSYIAPDNSLAFVSDDGMGFNNCHFWTNFEIIDLSFVRSPAYTSYFELLDKSGGFFYERWGDAPVRSIAASLMLNRSDIWNVDYAGYWHPPYGYCPRKLDPDQSCACDPHENIDYDFDHVSCRAKWDKANGLDPVALIHALNVENGVEEHFKEGEEPYVIVPPRLLSTKL